MARFGGFLVFCSFSRDLGFHPLAKKAAFLPAVSDMSATGLNQKCESRAEGRKTLAHGVSRRDLRHHGLPPILLFLQPRQGRKNRGRTARRTHETGGRF